MVFLFHCIRSVSSFCAKFIAMCSLFLCAASHSFGSRCFLYACFCVCNVYGEPLGLFLSLQNGNVHWKESILKKWKMEKYEPHPARGKWHVYVCVINSKCELGLIFISNDVYSILLFFFLFRLKINGPFLSFFSFFFFFGCLLICHSFHSAAWICRRVYFEGSNS